MANVTPRVAGRRQELELAALERLNRRHLVQRAEDPLLAARIVRSVRAVTTLPLTVKFRLGLDEKRRNYLEIGRVCQEEGADGVTLHARTARQMYTGEADWRHIGELKAAGLAVSVDSASSDELRRGAKAGADFLLSLTETALDIASDAGATPVLIPASHGDVPSLLRAAEAADKRGLPAILDPILDPIHFGFMSSLQRYAQVRRALPEAEMLMGTGNVTELTDADSGGVTAALLGVCSELSIRNVLVVQVSPHTRRTMQEHDAARRMMFAAREDRSLPQDYGGALLQLHDRAPFPSTPEDIAELAAQVRDANFRIEIAEDGIHVYNRDGHHVAQDAFTLFPKLGLDRDAPHAFYLGAELMKAEIAWRLGKRYAQDEPLAWGAAVDRLADDLTRLRTAGHTLRARASED